MNTLKKKNIQEQDDKTELAQILKSFYVEARKKDGSLKQCIIKQLLDWLHVLVD